MCSDTTSASLATAALVRRGTWTRRVIDVVGGVEGCDVRDGLRGRGRGKAMVAMRESWDSD
ncbi:hypothetical protein TIFTF001_012181 [Ficus carica]|uniref:Uncharacterized protein n=1 Tax=Ficus carica TaxID=3494 RepID=A0AA88DI10_FICCA|nr:hypothetical protein TIFTF001_012181 [Ficus carica]